MQVSKQFLRVQKVIKGALPSLGIGIIIAEYIITGFVMGYFLSVRMGAATLADFLVAYGTGFGTQLVRGYIVFHNQLGYEYITDRKGYIFFALALAVYTSIEAYFLEPRYCVSIIGLIISGFIVEIMYINALNKSSRFDLMNDAGALDAVKDMYKREIETRRFLESLTDLGLHPDQPSPTLPLPVPAIVPGSKNLPQSVTELIGSYDLESYQVNHIESLNGAGASLESLLDMIEMYYSRNLKRKKAFGGNGKDV